MMPPKHLRKEILGLAFFFLVVFSLGSLISYSPLDPSVHNASATEGVHNLFGRFGAHFAGILIGLFGLGAFWLPAILLLTAVQLINQGEPRDLPLVAVGGVLLILATGSLLAFKGNHLTILGVRFSTGGMLGIPIHDFLVRYANDTGAFIILALLWLVGLILATGFSLGRSSRGGWNAMTFFMGKIKALVDGIKERRRKAKHRQRIEQTQKVQKKRKINIQKPPPKPIKKRPTPRQEEFDFMRPNGGYHFPSIKFLIEAEARPETASKANLMMQSRLLEKKLEDFGVRGKVVTVTPGPVITTFEYEPAPGVKINKVVNLTDDLALALRAVSIRIEAPIPGKSVIGIEIPNETRELVRFRDIVISQAFEQSKTPLTVCLGKDKIGEPVVAALDKMPHLLIAGATGAGKSVGLNTMIFSLLYKAPPDDVKLIMVDPKRIELSLFNGIPHLVTPVVTDVKKATNALFWAVREMERRYELLSENKARNIGQYNRKMAKLSGDAAKDAEILPFIVIVIDELADLMMVASRDVETALTRLAQMARAAGIHLILATQRPSVDVLTGIIKANFPTRLTFQVSSKTDSRTIIDANGAENLLGNGDMLFMPPGVGRLTRIHGAYISEEEVTAITDFLKSQKAPEYVGEVTETPAREAGGDEKQEYDERYDEAVALVTKTGQASISMVQRHLRIGYNRAARIIEVMEAEGVVGPADGVKPREVLVRSYDDS